MGLKVEERDIRGLHVYTSQLPARRAFQLLPKLGAILGPALAKLDGAKLSVDADFDVLAPAFSEAFQRLSEADSDDLMRRIFECTQVRRGDAMLALYDLQNVDIAFEGNFRGLLGALWFAIEVNFGDFFDGNQLAEAVKAGKEESPSS